MPKSFGIDFDNYSLAKLIEYCHLGSFQRLDSPGRIFFSV